MKEKITENGCLSNPGKLAKLLKLHNDWRRGIGKFKWHEDPLKHEPPPFEPHELTIIMKSAIRLLKKMKPIKSSSK